MAIRKPIEKKVDTESLISRGAPVLADAKTDKKIKKAILINLPTSMLSDIKKALEKRVGINRNGWILEAIHEKLKSINDI